MASNSFENKCSILAELWMNYRDDEQMQDFVAYNDLGLPMSYLLHNEIVLPTQQSELYIDESYDLLVQALGVEDNPWNSLDEMLDAAK